MTSEVMNE